MFSRVKSRVLLISPSSNRFYVPTAPLGLSLIAGALPPEVEVRGLDLNVYKWALGLDAQAAFAAIEQWFKNNARAGMAPDVVGITVYQETLEEAVTYAKLARKYGATTVAGGIYPTLFPDDMPGVFDYLVRGDGVTAFPPLVDAIFWKRHGRERAEDWQIPGVFLWDRQNNRWLPGEEAVASAHNGPLLPARGIFDELNQGFRYFSARVMSSRGCPYGCSFCVNSELTAREWLPRPVDEVMDEVLNTLINSNISELCFSDDQFFGFCADHYRRAHEILRQIEGITRVRNLRINLQVRADHWLRALECEPGLVETLQAINGNFQDPNPETSIKIHGRPVRGVSLDIGVESNLQQRLDKFAKGLTVETNLAAIRKARELGLDLGVYMILFTPDLSLEQLREEFAIYNREVLQTEVFSKAAFYGFFQELVPYKGTRIYRELQASGDLVEKGQFTGFRFRDPRVTVFYILYLDELHRGLLDALATGEELVARIQELLEISALLGRLKTVEPVLEGVRCELRDVEEIKALRRRLVEFYNRIA